MPTPEEIKKAIREYALNNGSALCPASCIDYIINDFIEQLSKDYCIVPKSKLQEIDNVVCGTFGVENIAVRQSWEYIKRKLFEEEK